VIPFGGHEEFRLSNEDISHGARLWGNLLGLMCAHAWLEQRNREVREVAHGTRAVVATAADYEAAYELLKSVGSRSVVNLGETHRKIVQAVYELKQEDSAPYSSGYFSAREIAKHAGISPGTVSKNRTFLVASAGLLYEQENTKFLSIDEDADPSWWEEGDAMKGFPSPAEVARWEEGDNTPPPKPGNTGNTETPDQKPRTNGQKPVSTVGNTQEILETVSTNGSAFHQESASNGADVEYQEAALEALLFFDEAATFEAGGVPPEDWEDVAIQHFDMTEQTFKRGRLGLERASRVEYHIADDYRDSFYYLAEESEEDY
jgi:hypothetical protein